MAYFSVNRVVKHGFKHNLCVILMLSVDVSLLSVYLEVNNSNLKLDMDVGTRF